MLMANNLILFLLNLIFRELCAEKRFETFGNLSVKDKGSKGALDGIRFNLYTIISWGENLWQASRPSYSVAISILIKLLSL